MSDGARNVYLCPKTLTARFRYVIPTTLIHEAVHALGYYDECTPEKVEVSVQNDLGYELNGGLYPHCGTPRNFRLTRQTFSKGISRVHSQPKRQVQYPPYNPVYRGGF